MNIYSIDTFNKEFEKLIKKNAYKSLEQEIISYFFNKPIEQLLSGTRLNNSDTFPYIKKRLLGSGGFRFYFLILIKEENLYLMFVHPKTGSMGAENIDDESKSLLYKQVLNCIETQDLHLLQLSEDSKRLIFSKVE